MRWLGLVVLGAVVAGCGDGGGDTAAQSGSEPPKAASTSARPERKSFDPPKVFAAGASASIPGRNLQQNSDEVLATLSDGILYAGGSKSVQAFDGLTGKPLWTVKPTIDPQDQVKAHAPVVDESKHVVYYAFSVMVPGKGTTPAHPAIEVMAVDAVSGKQAWTTTVDVESKDPGNTGDGEVTVVGAGQGTVVITWYSSDFSMGNTYVLDTGTHQVRWKREQFLAGDVDSDVVVGNAGKPFIGETRVLTALGVADGSEKWATPPGQTPAEITPISAKLVATNRQDYGSGDWQFDILDVTSGKALYTKKVDTALGLSYRATCHYDQKSIIVCDDTDGEVFAFDTANVGPKPLWEIVKITSRVPPDVVSAYHGLIYGYGSGAANEPVVLDAQTGQDAPDAPGIAPILVDKYVGVTSKGETHVPTK
jgi:hypothetical protein